MTDADFATFEKAFHRMAKVHLSRVKDADRAELCQTYFKTLGAAPLDDVLATGKILLQRSKHFPKPAEWYALVTHAPDAALIPAGVRIMSVAEVVEWNAAMKRCCEGDLCVCAACVDAHVTDKPIRFVPEEDADGTIVRAWHPGRKQLVGVGHWIHGYDLLRWYLAREACFATATAVGPRMVRLLRRLTPVTERVDAIFHPPDHVREMGEEG
jgi:hypothetical protein